MADAPSTPGGSRLTWSAAEDEILINAVASNSGKNWKAVAAALPNRTRAQCAHRYQKVLNPTLKKGAWTNEEDNLLSDAVIKLGSGKWSRIAEAVPGRNGKQCRERWQNHLRGDVTKEPFSQQEDDLIIRLRTELGNRWAQIARHLPGRTENAVKNRWNAKLALDAKASGILLTPRMSQLRSMSEGSASVSSEKSSDASSTLVMQTPRSSTLGSFEWLQKLSIVTGAASPLSRQSSLLSVLSAVSSETLRKNNLDPSTLMSKRARDVVEKVKQESKDSDDESDEEQDMEEESKAEEEVEEEEEEEEEESKEEEGDDDYQSLPPAKKFSHGPNGLLSLAQAAVEQQPVIQGSDWKSRLDSLLSASQYSVGQFKKSEAETIPASMPTSQLDWLASIAAASALTSLNPSRR